MFTKAINRIHFQNRIIDNNATHHDQTYHRHDIQTLAKYPKPKQNEENINHNF